MHGDFCGEWHEWDKVKLLLVIHWAALRDYYMESSSITFLHENWISSLPGKFQSNMSFSPVLEKYPCEGLCSGRGSCSLRYQILCLRKQVSGKHGIPRN